MPGKSYSMAAAMLPLRFTFMPSFTRPSLYFRISLSVSDTRWKHQEQANTSAKGAFC
jgi:hypothetical protein